MGQLKAWDDQIAKGLLRAPGPGLVVYGRYDWDEPVYEGMDVRERQEIILLPDITAMVADIRVPESQIGKLAVGQRASLRVDAFPGRTFTGTVTTVSSLPEPSPRSQVQKNYITTVAIDGRNEGGAIRPGMNATVTIAVGTIADVLNVPLPALERQGDAHFVWKVLPAGPKPVAVEIGANNLTHVEILAGLEEGERIYLVRPPGMELPRDERAQPPAEPLQEPSSEPSHEEVGVDATQSAASEPGAPEPDHGDPR
jgi:multidrug efflux pump subunit AcrA (membrane-fusion protein)